MHDMSGRVRFFVHAPHSLHCGVKTKQKYIENHISVLSSDIEDKVQTIAVSSNDTVTHPSDSPGCLRNQAQLQGCSFPYLYDESQVFAKELKAACTPDFYLFSNAGNRKFNLFYHGQLDSSRPSNDISITGEDLHAAVKGLNKNSKYPHPQQPSLGCNIKWTSKRSLKIVTQSFRFCGRGVGVRCGHK